MIREIKQKDVDECIRILGVNSPYSNLKTRILAFLQSDQSYAYGYFQNAKLQGFVLFSNTSFDVTVHMLVGLKGDEAVIKSLVGQVKQIANTLGAESIYVNYHNLSKEVANILEIMEQYRLE